MKETGNQFFDSLTPDEQKQFEILFENKSIWYEKKLDGTINYKKRIIDDTTYNKYKTSLQDFIYLQKNKKKYYCLSCIYFSDFKCGDFFEYEINKQISFSMAIFSGETEFKNLIFEKEASFEESKFLGDVIFSNCKFNNLTDFTKTLFCKHFFMANVFFYDVYFLENFFLDKTIFIFLKADYFIMRECTVSHLKINNSFIKNSDIDRLFIVSINGKRKEMIPLSSKQIADRQTARFLKNLYENQKNIPNSSQLFAIEQDFFIKELQDENISDPNKLSVLFTLYANKIVSNFGTDWVRAILFLLLFGFIADSLFVLIKFKSNIEFDYNILCAFIGVFATYVLTFFIKGNNFKNIIIISLTIAINLLALFLNLDNLNQISKLINPINAFKDDDTFKGYEAFGALVRVISATIIYQIIVAFRQFTRRA